MPGPLAGLRVVDVSIMAAGPWVGALLGQLGADVIKVEPPAGDGTRWVEPLQHGMGTNYLCLNVNKRDIVLDFKVAEQRAQALDLAATADVFIQNFRGGVIERLGLGYATVAERNPRIVYCSVSGFGETGPLAQEACADFIMQAYSGFARLNGQPGDELEAFRFTGFIDLTTSIVALGRCSRRVARARKHGSGTEGRGLDGAVRARDAVHAGRGNARDLARPAAARQPVAGAGRPTARTPRSTGRCSRRCAPTSSGAGSVVRSTRRTSRAIRASRPTRCACNIGRPSTPSSSPSWPRVR